MVCTSVSSTGDSSGGSAAVLRQSQASQRW